MLKLSIIIPIYNAEKYLKRCLDSIINQTFNNWEVLAINDGSKDGSFRILREYANQDSRIKAIDKENEGVSKTRNLGLSMATGEFIGFVDADDYLEPNMYELLINKMENEKNDIVFCHYKKQYEEDDRIILQNEYNIQKLVENPKDIKYFFYDSNNEKIIDGIYSNKYIMGSIWRCIFKQSLISYMNLQFSPKLFIAEDLIFLLDYLKHCNNIGFVSEYLYFYYINKNSAISKKHKSNFFINVKNLMLSEIEFITDNDFYDNKSKKSIICHIKYTSCMNIVVNELKNKQSGILNIKKISRDPFFKKLISFSSFTHVIFDRKYKGSFKRLIFLIIIKLRMWHLINSYLLKKVCLE